MYYFDNFFRPMAKGVLTNKVITKLLKTVNTASAKKEFGCLIIKHNINMLNHEIVQKQIMVRPAKLEAWRSRIKMCNLWASRLTQSCLVWATVESVFQYSTFHRFSTTNYISQICNGCIIMNRTLFNISNNIINY